jgi:hypothetical protein
VAAETIEVVPIAEDERIQREAAGMREPEPWPGDAGLEAASLAPLAGDAAEPVSRAEHHEPGEAIPAAAAPTAESEQGFPFVSPSERQFETATTTAPAAPEPADAERVPEPAPPTVAQPEPASREAVAAPQPSEPERVLEPASATTSVQPETVSPEPEPRPDPQRAHDVQTVTDKPANPRRGWWQRLVNS